MPKGRASRTTGRNKKGKKSIMSKTKKKQLISKGQKKVKMLGQKIKAKGTALSRKSKFNFISFLSRLVKLKSSKATFVMKSLIPLLQENRVILFGGLAESITRAQISEPYNAGAVQGPVLYGVGTGPQNAPKPGGDYSSFIDILLEDIAEQSQGAMSLEDTDQLGGADAPLPMHSDARISRCWATAIALTFGQGRSLHKSENPLIWDWDKSGGGTNHEMEHAIKCITQAMLNFLSQSNTTDDKTMHTALYDFFISILREQGKEDRARKMSQQITKLLRKQQVIAGLPSCSLFNQFKCALDLIKIKLKQIPGEGWFYVSVEPDEGEILKVVKKMKAGKDQSGKMEAGKYNPKGGCNFYGMGMLDDKNKKDGTPRPRSVWLSKERLDRCYRQEGSKGQKSVYDVVADPVKYQQELDYAWSLKNMSEEHLKNLIVGRTQVVCDKYNEISQLPEIGQKLSGIIIASSLMMLSISMGRVLEDNKDLKTSSDPQLYELGAKASGFLTKLTQGGGLEQALNNYEDTSDYTDFKDMITNPVTKAHLESAMTVQNLFGQRGGAAVVSGMSIEDDRGKIDLVEPNAMGNGVDGMEYVEERTPKGRPIPERISKVLGAKRKEDEIDMQPRTKRFQSRPIMNPGELPYEDITLLLTLKSQEEEYDEAYKLFMDVEYLLNQRYSEAGTIPLFLRIINGYDEDNVVYYDEALKEDERVLNEFNIKTSELSTHEITVDGIDLKYDGEDFLRELGFGIEDEDTLMEELEPEPEPEMGMIRKRTYKRRKRKITRKRQKKKDTTRKKTGRKKSGQTKKRKRRKTVKKDSLYKRLLKRLSY
tara:strand:+ start:2744 stop:5209 length:2466 start_codon:yes stop_codon:yes gene_type:complete